MRDLPLLKQIYYTFLGYLYWFTFFTTTHQILGIRLSTIVKLLAVALVLAVWIYDWGSAALAVSIGLLVWVLLVYWLADRAGYFRFVEGVPTLPADEEYSTLTPYRRVACIATGIFSVQDWEKSVLLCPAAYWQVPRGDHAMMVEHEPQKYLYQFFDLATMGNLQRGWLLHGSRPRHALSISYQSIWGPEFAKEEYSIFGGERKPVDPKMRTIYISFSDNGAEELICGNIMADVQRHQKHEEAADQAN